ncbi:hypothetical protein FDK21_18135 [Cohaesibacter sp. CAU 1516]|uniref:YcaO-like family protein n=1 Tax=Cohaesibacter sp. CAU 1516 TaxID=2576038 RepID=UPI0010FD7E24|nr:YcaO-like family protein [Cohaesibacter sp. CAU 1516]TLP43136.1 hypothetical protein FDK21_18135 [Cohaesibacter sp. CAU 1516]
MTAEFLYSGIRSFRKCTPGETFDKVSPYFSRLGITRVASQTGLDRVGIPVWCAYSPNARAIVIAQGKGADDECARTSAAMEAVERIIATQPDCETLCTTQEQLQSDGCEVHPMKCLLTIGKQPIEPDETINWARTTNLLTHAPTWVPFDAVSFDRTALEPRFWHSSDGLASGNTWAEAVLHGLLERVERDALTLWAVTNPAKRLSKRIDPASLEDTELQMMLEKIDAAGLEIALFDISSDLDIACISALLAPKKRSPGSLRHVDVTLGAGASPFPLIAASRAISEVVQSRMTFIAGARDDLLPSTFTQPASPITLKAFDAPFGQKLDGMPVMAVGDTETALDRLVAHLAERDIDELYAVDIGPDWLPVSVAKVFAPQLENPDGDRKVRFGSRALLRSLQ